jgi:hypothetical protein
MIENSRLDISSLLQKGAISWKSSKQSVTASSTVYAKSYGASGQVTWLKKLVPR